MNKTWLRDTPYDVRDAAMDDLLKAYASGFARKEERQEDVQGSADCIMHHI